MAHIDLIAETLKRFNREQLNEMYVDSSLDIDDQETITLESHIKDCSENWLFRTYSLSSDSRSANSLEDNSTL